MNISGDDGQRHVVKIAAALMLLLSPASAVHAAEHRIVCPLKLEADSLQVVKPPSGWTPFIPSFFWLHSAGPMYGPPSVMAVLKEDVHKINGNKIISRWVWQRAQEPPDSDGKWMACNYGDGNDIVLSKKIDDNTSECTDTYTKKKLGRDDLDIRCKW